jgi:hypothetical protein
MMLKLWLVFLVLMAVPACADSIDGSWCSKDGQHLSIVGPEITLPNDTKIRGVYRRHEFLYTAPAGTADAGSRIYLQLQGEDRMASYHFKDNQPVDPVQWDRCAAPPKTS